MRYLRSSIHSVSACEPRPSAASIAALYPRIAWSLDMRPLVRGLSSRSARKPATASAKPLMSTQMRARCFAQIRLFLTALHGSITALTLSLSPRMLARKKLRPLWRLKVWNPSAPSRMLELAVFG
jgi:hypothetical protein